MGLFSFIGDAGKRLFGKDDNLKPQTKEEEVDLAIKIKEDVLAMGLPVTHLGIRYENGTVTVRGEAEDQATLEKVILAVGNVAGVEVVDDLLTLAVDTTAETLHENEIAAPAPQSTFHTVERGDTLGKIAKTHYGAASKYPLIFEANRPMLKDPDLIYPGQVLRIPPLPVA